MTSATQTDELATKLLRMRRAYRTLAAGNRALLRSTSERELLDEVCRVAVELAGYRLAWIGIAEEEEHRVRPVAQVGFEEGYLDAANITWCTDARGQGPTGTAIRTGRPSVAQHIATEPRYAPWRADALRRGYASSVALPLTDAGRCFGALNIYAAEPNAFDADELALLEQVAADLGFGLVRLWEQARTARLEAERKELEGLLLHSQKLEALGRLAGGIAHDFNNVLTAVIASVRLIPRQPGCPPAVAVEADEAERAALRGAALVRRLLAFSRGEPNAGGDCDPDTVVSDTRAMLERLVGSDLEIKTELASKPWRVRVPAGEIEHLLANLVVNARDAMPDGGRVLVRTERVTLVEGVTTRHGKLPPGEFVVLRVEDTGSGMSPEVLAHAFEPFFTTKPAGEGTGLGLPIVFGIVKRAGGGIVLESTPGHGTRFALFLPRATEPAAGRP